MAEDRLSDNPYINRFELVNPDPELSELKYHFLLRKTQLPHDNYWEFRASVSKGFLGAKIDQNDITNVQLAESYGKNVYDVLVGLRRDSLALHIYSNSRKFVYHGKEAVIQLAEAYRTILEMNGTLPGLPQERSQRCSEQSNLKLSPLAKENDEGMRRQSRSRSRQRERGHYKRKQEWAGKVYGVFYPKDWTKESTTTLLADNLRCARNQIHVQIEVLQEIRCLIISLRTQALLSNLLAGTRGTEGMVLLLRQTEVSQQGLLRSIRQRQLRATRVSSTHSDHPFQELCRALVSFRDFNLRVVTVAPYEKHLIVMIQNRAQGIISFLRIAGWKFETVAQCIKLPQSSTERWQKFLDVHKLH